MNTRRKKPKQRSTPRGAAPPANSAATPITTRIRDWLDTPQPIARLELLRIFIPLTVLGFMASRIAHADDWLSSAGFSVPDLGGADWRQPLYLPPLPPSVAWLVAGAMVASGLLVAVGFRTRLAAGLFALLLLYVALADRMAAFTVSKLSPLLMLALLSSPCGARWSVDAWLAQKREPGVPQPEWVAGGCVRFVQLLLPIFYCSSGICKARGDWLDHPAVLWTHLHSSYQTVVSHFLANALPSWSWTLLQGATLAFEVLAPLWFALARTRPFALAYGLLMHAMIGLMFGPVIWFSLLMMSLLVASYAPLRASARAPCPV